MDRFVVTREMRRRLLVAVWVVVLVPLWLRMQSWIAGEHADHVLAMLVLPALESVWADFLFALLMLLGQCYVWLMVERQLPAADRWGRAACWVIVLGKGLNVLLAYLPALLLGNEAPMAANGWWYAVQTYVHSLCSLMAGAAMIWIGVVLFRRYGGRIKEAGIALLAYLLVASTVVPLFFFLVLSYPGLSVLPVMISTLCMIVPYVFLYRAFAEAGE